MISFCHILAFLLLQMIIISLCNGQSTSNSDQNEKTCASDSMLPEILSVLNNMQTQMESMQSNMTTQMDSMQSNMQTQMDSMQSEIGDMQNDMKGLKFGQNLAFRKPAYSSSVFSNQHGRYPPYLAVDGKFLQASAFDCTHTLLTKQAWFVVDLLEKYLIGTVVLTPRPDGAEEQLSNVRIGVGNTFDGHNFNPSEFTLCASVGHKSRLKPLQVECETPLQGRYVALYRVPEVAAQYLTICEFEVFKAV